MVSLDDLIGAAITLALAYAIFRTLPSAPADPWEQCRVLDEAERVAAYRKRLARVEHEERCERAHREHTERCALRDGLPDT